MATTTPLAGTTPPIGVSDVRENEQPEGQQDGDETAPDRARAAQAAKSRALSELPEEERKQADPDDLPEVGAEHDPSPTDPTNAPEGSDQSEAPRS